MYLDRKNTFNPLEVPTLRKSYSKSEPCVVLFIPFILGIFAEFV